MQRVKKKKKPDKQTKTPSMYVKQTNYLNLAVMVRALYICYGWRKKRISRFCEAYLGFIQEIAEKGSTVSKFVKETKELTGIDVTKLLDEVIRRP